MSWSLSYQSLEAFEDDRPTYATNDLSPEAMEQVSEARLMARAIVESGAVGVRKDFFISLSGHANPSHEPTSGWANDCIAVNVSQKSPPEPTPPTTVETPSEVPTDG